MTPGFTSHDDLEKYLWLVFHNLENKPDADWRRPSCHVWEAVARTLKADGDFSKKGRLPRRHFLKPVKTYHHEKE